MNHLYRSLANELSCYALPARRAHHNTISFYFFRTISDYLPRRTLFNEYIIAMDIIKILTPPLYVRYMVCTTVILSRFTFGTRRNKSGNHYRTSAFLTLYFFAFTGFTKGTAICNTIARSLKCVSHCRVKNHNRANTQSL